MGSREIQVIERDQREGLHAVKSCSNMKIVFKDSLVSLECGFHCYIGVRGKKTLQIKVVTVLYHLISNNFINFIILYINI